jgi:hypothetical protein
VEAFSRDFGLADFMSHYGFSGDTVQSGKYTVLHLKGSALHPDDGGNQPENIPLHFPDICNIICVNPEIDVVMSGNYVAASRFVPRFNEQWAIVALRKEVLYRYQVFHDEGRTCAALMAKPDFPSHFEDFLWQGPHTAPIDWDSKGAAGLFYEGSRSEGAKPLFFSHGNEVFIYFDKDGEYSFSYGEGISKVAANNSIYSVSKEQNQLTTSAEFLRIIVPEEVLKLEHILASDAWPDLPGLIPLLLSYATRQTNKPASIN